MILVKKVSIIVPVYNVEKYLKECLDSLIYQSFKEIEIILIDDGSTDKSGSICDAYAVKDIRISVYHQKNQGQSAAKNLGLSKAQSEYVYFADSDDILHHCLIEILYKEITNNSADIIQCKHSRERDFLLKDIPANKPYFISSRDALKSLHQSEWHFDSTVMWTKLFKKKLFDGLQFPALKYHEDFSLTYKLFYRTNKIIFLNIILYYYRPSETSITSKIFSIQKFDAIYALEEKYVFMINLKDKELIDKALQNLVDMYFLFYLKCRLYLPERKRDYVSFLKKSRALYMKTIKAKYIGLKQKVKYTVFIVTPNLFFLILKIFKGIYQF